MWCTRLSTAMLCAAFMIGPLSALRNEADISCAFEPTQKHHKCSKKERRQEHNIGDHERPYATTTLAKKKVIIQIVL